MNLFMNLYMVLLFVLLTPGILLTLPKGGKKLTVAIVHGIVFVVVYYFTHMTVWGLTEGFQSRAPSSSFNLFTPTNITFSAPKPMAAAPVAAKPMATAPVAAKPVAATAAPAKITVGATAAPTLSIQGLVSSLTGTRR